MLEQLLTSISCITVLVEFLVFGYRLISAAVFLKHDYLSAVPAIDYPYLFVLIGQSVYRLIEALIFIYFYTHQATADCAADISAYF